MQNKTVFCLSIVVATILLVFLADNRIVAQQGPSTTGGDALWHLPKFGENGWFIHAHNGRVRVCNMDQASVVGDKPGPKCSGWE
jgi:hypothetical protein